MRKRNNRNDSFFKIVLLGGFFVVIASVLFSFSTDTFKFNWKDIRLNVKDSISLYERYSITSGEGGYGKNFDFEVKRRQWIMNYATIEELQKLTTFPEGTIKAIAYEGLLRKEQYSQKKELILEILKQNNFVAYQEGCFGYSILLKDYFMDYVLQLNPKRNFQFKTSLGFGLTEEEKKQIILQYEKSSDN